MASDTRGSSAFICAVLARILAVPNVQRTDDFFELGGDSLAAVNLMAAIEDQFGIVLDPVEIFERPKIDEFAGWLSESLASQSANRG